MRPGKWWVALICLAVAIAHHPLDHRRRAALWSLIATQSADHIAAMLIRTEQTPNPATRKFLPGQTVMEAGTRDFADADSAEASPLAKRAVRQRHGRRRVLRPRLHLGDRGAGRLVDRPRAAGARDPARPFRQRRAAVRAGHAPPASTSPTTPTSTRIPADADIIDQIKELIETRVRPAVAQDGGDIAYKGYRDGRLYLSMHGACSGCPSSTVTLKRGIESLIRHYVPEVNPSKPSNFRGLAALSRM